VIRINKVRKGFTLLEMVISIAALSLLGVFIVQMFMASANLNSRAKDADKALTLAITEIDALKSSHRPPEPGGSVFFSYFDKDWTKVESGSGRAKFQLALSIFPSGSVPGLYEIVAAIEDVHLADGSVELVSINAKKYFPQERGAASR